MRPIYPSNLVFLIHFGERARLFLAKSGHRRKETPVPRFGGHLEKADWSRSRSPGSTGRSITGAAVSQPNGKLNYFCVGHGVTVEIIFDHFIRL